MGKCIYIHIPAAVFMVFHSVWLQTADVLTAVCMEDSLLVKLQILDSEGQCHISCRVTQVQRILRCVVKFVYASLSQFLSFSHQGLEQRNFKGVFFLETITPFSSFKYDKDLFSAFVVREIVAYASAPTVEEEFCPLLSIITKLYEASSCIEFLTLQ